jgi:DNA-binding NarL/FixJ family response regulator
VLVLTSEEELAPLIDALRAGATGYLTKETSLDELVDAAKAVAKGEVAVPPQMLGELLTTLVQQGGKKTDDSIMTLSKLTRRERQVLALLADGSDKDAIAVALAISPQTARTHVQNILAKLGLHSRLEAAAFARKHPILKQFVASDR